MSFALSAQAALCWCCVLDTMRVGCKSVASWRHICPDPTTVCSAFAMLPVHMSHSVWRNRAVCVHLRPHFEHNTAVSALHSVQLGAVHEGHSMKNATASPSLWINPYLPDPRTTGDYDVSVCFTPSRLYQAA